jgi:hypothetical protein
MNVRNSLLLLAFILVAGCQPLTMQRRDDGPVPVTLRVDDAAYWLEEWFRIVSLPADQVEQAVQLRQEEFARNPDARNRLRLVLLLAEGPPAVRDERRAQALLAQLDEAQTSPSAHALAELLRRMIREQLAARGKIATLEQGLSESEQRVKELERQLQELTDIEQSIQQRETPVQRKEKE